MLNLKNAFCVLRSAFCVLRSAFCVAQPAKGALCAPCAPKLIFLLLIALLGFVACGGNSPSDPPNDPPNDPPVVWKPGEIAEAGGIEWIEFTAGAPIQYIHVKLGTLTDLYVQVFTSDMQEVSSRTNLYGSTLSAYLSALNTGETYSIKVWPYEPEDFGTYEILVNDRPSPDPITPVSLTVDSWKPGTIAAGEIDWFTFTAGAPIQYIHFKLGTLDDFYMQVYRTAGGWQPVGSRTSIDGDTLFTYLTGLDTGGTYYIKVWAGAGTYEIKFNAHPAPEPVTATPLTEDTWKSGEIAAPGGIEWFEFTPSFAEQYIHFKFGTLTDLYVQVYTGSGQPAGSQTNIYGGTIYKRLTGLNTNETYSIKIWPYDSDDSGTYEILFNALPLPVPIDPVSLTDNTWEPGDIEVSGGIDQFQFIPGASHQYIHFKLGSLKSLYVQVYNQYGQAVGSPSSTSGRYLSGLTPGVPYFIRVNSRGTGTYEIKCNTQPTPEPVTATSLTDGSWKPGDIAEAGGIEWFEFTAGAPDQYIHCTFGTLDDLYVQVYAGTGQELGSRTNLYGGTSYKHLSGLDTGGTYYIKVWPYSDGDSGTYRIGVTGTETPPADTP